MTWLLFFILTLGTARVTQLICEDHLPLIATPRERIVARKPTGNLAYLVNCWWCVSVYVAAGASAFAVWALHIHPTVYAPWLNFVLLWPALSFGAVLLMGLADVFEAHGTDG